MFNFLFRRYHYYVVCKANLTSDKSLVSAPIYKFVKRYFFWRGRSVKYFEPFISKETQETFAIFGTAKGERTVNRNCLIFLLEVFASLSSPAQFKISNDFTSHTRTFGDQTITIYRVKK